MVKSMLVPLGVMALVSPTRGFISTVRQASRSVVQPVCVECHRRQSATLLGSTLTVDRGPPEVEKYDRKTTPTHAVLEVIQEEPQSFTYDDDSPTVVWTARKAAKKKIQEGERSLLAYLALPPSQYSLLNPKQIKRISESEFRCEPGSLNFFGNNVSPILYMSVKVQDETSTVDISLNRVELEGPPAICSANNSFTCECSNIVTCSEPDRSGKRMLFSEVNLRIEVQVPKETWIPLPVLRRTGTFIMQRSFDLMVPQFLNYLAKDYKTWSQGDNTRVAVESSDTNIFSSV